MPVYDLSQDVETGMPTYPAYEADDGPGYRGDPCVRIEPWVAGEEFQVSQVYLGSHAGTHVDAPTHAVDVTSEDAPDPATLEDFEVEDFRLQARQIDVTGRGERAPVTVEDVPDGVLQDDEIEMVVFHSGWAEKWGEDGYFDHPYLDARLADVLAEAGLAVGVDFLSPDETPTGDREPAFPAHEALLGQGLPIYENLAGLDSFPETRFEFHGYPIPLASERNPPGMDGAPVRAVAVVE